MYLFNKIATVFLILFFVVYSNPLLADDIIYTSAPTSGGVQLRLIPSVSFYHENALYKGLSINGEFSSGVSGWVIDKLIYTPVSLTFEPRIYYALRKRSELGHNLKTSPGGYFNAFVSYVPFSLLDNTLNELENKIQIGLGWGQRKQIYKNLHYELGLGVKFWPNESFDYEKPSTGIFLPYFKVRLGYTIY